MIYNIRMSIKYKIEDAKKNKNLINDEIKLSKIKSKGGPGDGGRKPSKQRKAPAWFIEFRDEQREFNKSVMQKFDKQKEFNTRIEKQVSNLRNNLNRIVKLNNLKH